MPSHINKLSLLGGCIGLCLLGGLFERWNEFLVFDRSGLAEGQIWRMWTAHFVHFGSGHLLPNLFTSMVLICLLQGVMKREVAIILVVIPVTISLALLCLSSRLEEYAGFSGVASALVIRLAAERLIHNIKDAASWILLIAFGAKIYREFIGNESLAVNFSHACIQVEPFAHLAGSTAMALAFFVMKAAKKQNEIGFHKPKWISKIKELRR